MGKIGIATQVFIGLGLGLLVGVFFGEPGKTVPDPYFGGEGPDRTGCTLCGRCMVGCVRGAKNTLVKNYLWFAERLGAVVSPERTVIDIRPLGAADGSDGYEVESERSGAWLRKDRRVQRAEQRRSRAGQKRSGQRPGPAVAGSHDECHEQRVKRVAGLRHLGRAFGQPSAQCASRSVARQSDRAVAYCL